MVSKQPPPESGSYNLGSVLQREIGADDKDLLVRAVKLAQKHSFTGRLGSWKGFIEVEGRTGRIDPVLNDWKVLAQFLEAVTEPRQQKALRRLARWHAQVSVEQPPAKKRKVTHGNDDELSEQEAPAHAAASAWDLMQQTMSHPQFDEHFNLLPSWERGWKRLPRTQLDTTQDPVLVGLDCEMVASSADSRELVKLAVVNAAGKLVYHELIKPRKRVLDHRTAITGLTKQQLKGIGTRREDAQRSVQQLLSDNHPAILVGHALHNDLRALRLDVGPVIDTSKLFKYRGLKNYSPKLADLARDVLGQDLRPDASQPHECATDAATAMALAQHAMLHGCCDPLQPPDMKVSGEEQSMLLLHGIPGDQDINSIRTALPNDTLQALQSITQWAPVPGKPQQLHLMFASSSAARKAFSGVRGKLQKDVLGRQQKVVTLKSSKSVKIREMAAEKGRAFGQDRMQKQRKHTHHQAGREPR